MVSTMAASELRFDPYLNTCHREASVEPIRPLDVELEEDDDEPATP